jgi:hypothetical protein
VEDEIWKDIEDFEGLYQVSNLGRVKSMVRPYRRTEKIITATDNGHGYLIVGLRRPSSVKGMLVHRLVMQAFEPISNPEDMQVNHKDFNTYNNRLDNLEWCTVLENNQHFWREGGHIDLSSITGSNHHLSSLTEEDVLNIRAMHATGKYSVNGLAKILGMPESTVRCIVKRKTWKHL